MRWEEAGDRAIERTTRSGDNSQSDERGRGRQNGKADDVVSAAEDLTSFVTICSTPSSLVYARFARDV